MPNNHCPIFQLPGIARAPTFWTSHLPGRPVARHGRPSEAGCLRKMDGKWADDGVSHRTKWVKLGSPPYFGTSWTKSWFFFFCGGIFDTEHFERDGKGNLCKAEDQLAPWLNWRNAKCFSKRATVDFGTFIPEMIHNIDNVGKTVRSTIPSFLSLMLGMKHRNMGGKRYFCVLIGHV